jgi:AmmeMemoRadiSam system protein A
MGSSSITAARDLAAALVPYFTPENLFIISSNFSQYPSYGDAQRIDKLTGDAILKKDPKHFYNILRNNSLESVPNLNTSCSGWSSIMTMLYLSNRRVDLSLSSISYKNSGDLPIGDKERVVGYWAIAGHSIPRKTEAFTLQADEKQSLLEIARYTLEQFINSGELARVPETAITSTLDRPVGAFVSLYMGGRLRGRMGNFNPSNPLFLVVQEMTLAAATGDERFAPVESSELEYLDIEISVPTPLQQINSIEEFQLGKHGIYISKDGKSGAYLPQVAVQNGWNAEEFFGNCARENAGIGWEGWKEADLYIFEAAIFGENKKK